MIWTFGRKSVLRTVKILGQIWDAESGRKLWEGYAVGYNSMVPYESPPLPEEMMDQAVESFVDIMLPGPENGQKISDYLRNISQEKPFFSPYAG